MGSTSLDPIAISALNSGLANIHRINLVWSDETRSRVGAGAWDYESSTITIYRKIAAEFWQDPSVIPDQSAREIAIRAGSVNFGSYLAAIFAHELVHAAVDFDPALRLQLQSINRELGISFDDFTQQIARSAESLTISHAETLRGQRGLSCRE